MSRLTPEKRLDKNGRLVTRHVRQEPGAGSVPNLPSRPALAAPEGTPVKGPVKLRASQRQQKKMTILYRKTNLLPSWGFRGDYEDFDSTFTASEEEAYAVAAVCLNEGDAVKLLSLGVRSADAARSHLESWDLGRLIADRSEVMHAALASGVRFEDMIEHRQTLVGERPLEARIGALRFQSSSLGSVKGVRWVVKRILNGDIDFEDIKAVGVSRLKDHQKILYFAPLLEKARAGADGFSVEAIRDLAIRIGEDEHALTLAIDVGAFAKIAGAEATVALPSLRAAGNVYRMLGMFGETDMVHDGAERLLYAARFTAAAGWDINAARGFYAAGVPLETAIAVHKSGGTAEQAAGAHRDGVRTALADGYL